VRRNDALENAKAELAKCFTNSRTRRFIEIITETGKSKGAVSKWLNLLLKAGAVEKVSVPFNGWRATDAFDEIL
jgi:hypothetical protein